MTESILIPGRTLAETERWLNLYPLPVDFVWRGTKVAPRYHLKKGWGFWLRTTPYHQGLFEACHAALAALPAGLPLPTPAELAELVQAREAAHGAQEDLPLDLDAAQ